MKRGWLLALTLALAGCAGASPRAAGPHGRGASRSLFARLGGQPAIGAVVDDFLGRVIHDERISLRFANTDVPRLRRLLVEQICAATGGPCKYSGGDMRTVHAGMAIDDDEFNALVEDLQASLAHFHVGEGEQKELLTALGGLRGEIVGQ